MRKLEGLKPEKVFRYFEDISAIPRGSGKEEAVSRYCLDFARERGLAAWRDEHNNVVITKPAAKGYEAVPGMILQGHLDMVWEKDEDCEKDFEKEAAEWEAKYQKFLEADPERAALIMSYVNRTVPENIAEELLKVAPVDKPVASRASSGAVLQRAAALVPSLFGTALAFGTVSLFFDSVSTIAVSFAGI